MSSTSNDSNWKLKEKTVTILERHLEHSAKIERDINLPVLTSLSGRARQCDVVITEGTIPRQTISIAEVQNRNSKPTINDFEGWIVKMGQVGAQHLICVSEKGFPASIKERAKELGPTVRLLTLKQLEHRDKPFPLSIFSNDLQLVRYDKLVGLQIEYNYLVKVNSNDKKELPSPHEKIFKLDGHFLSVTDIMDSHFFKTPKNLEELPINQTIPLIVNFTKLGNDFQHKTYDGDWIQVKSIKINFRLFIKNKKCKWELESYEQDGYGQIGWVSKVKTTIDEKVFHAIQPIKLVSKNQYYFGKVIMMSEHDTFIYQNGITYKAEQYRDKSI